MLKILNNDKFTTAQNRHFLVSLKIPILNTLPVRAKVKANRSPILLPLQGVGVYALIPRALPWAKNWLPFQGARGEVAGDYPFQVGCSNPEKSRLAAAPSQRRFALARIIVCCGASIVAHFARKVRATNT